MSKKIRIGIVGHSHIPSVAEIAAAFISNNKELNTGPVIIHNPFLHPNQIAMAKGKNNAPALFDMPVEELPAVNPFAAKARPRISMLSLDIATKCGWCTATASGTWDLTPKKDESKGMRLIRFRAKLKEICELEAIKLIVFEGMASFSKHPNFVASEMMGVLKLFAEEAGIEYRAYPPATIKKFGTGKGNASKELMIEAAMIYNQDVKTEDEADAIILFHLAKKDLEL